MNNRKQKFAVSEPARVSKAIILVRVSSKDQEDGHSLDAQRERLIKYCARHNFDILEIFTITESSTRGERKKFMDMIEFAKRQKGTVAIVADAVDRVQRSFKDSVYLDDLVRRDKIELHFFRENMIIGREASASDHMRWDFCVLGAKSYVMQLSENVKRSIDYKIRQGQWYGPAPLGYLNQRDDRGNSIIVHDPIRAPLVYRLFSEYATGAYTLSDMQRRCKEFGLTSKAGKELSKSTLYRMVQSIFYYGEMLIKGEIMQHCHEPLISKAMWEECQAVLHGWDKKPFQYGGKEFLFRGLLTCGVTGRVISADTKTKKYKNGTSTEFTYLVTWNPENPEKKMWVREDAIIAQVEDALARLACNDADMMTASIAAVKEANKYKQESHNREVGALKKEHTDIQAKLDRLVDLLAEGVLPPDDYRVKREQYKRRQEEVIGLIHAYDGADNAFGSTMEKLMKVAMGAHKGFKSSKTEEKRELLNFVFSNLTLKGGTLCYTYNFPFGQFQNMDDCAKWRKR
jgi:site-specific DNA recombinase